MARGRRQRGGKPCVRPRCRASASSGGRQVLVAFTTPIATSGASRTATTSLSPATTLAWICLLYTSPSPRD
eukprot:355280-Alexandrium_andersonii.AAC.1